MNQPVERIVSAAIRQKGEVFTGSSHVQVVKSIVQNCEEITAMAWVYGFVTNTGRFVDRCEAMNIARDADQLNDRPTEGQTALYSQDLKEI